MIQLSAWSLTLKKPRKKKSKWSKDLLPKRIISLPHDEFEGPVRLFLPQALKLNLVKKKCFDIAQDIGLTRLMGKLK